MQLVLNHILFWLEAGPLETFARKQLKAICELLVSTGVQLDRGIQISSKSASVPYLQTFGTLAFLLDIRHCDLVSLDSYSPHPSEIKTSNGIVLLAKSGISSCTD